MCKVRNRNSILTYPTFGKLDSDDDTHVTASVFNSPSESIQEINCIPIAPYERLSNYSQQESFHTAPRGDITHLNENRRLTLSTEEDVDDDSDNTLVDGVSIASSCNTYISEGGDAYKCARDEFFFSKENKIIKSDSIENLGELNLIDFDQMPVSKYGRYGYDIK